MFFGMLISGITMDHHIGAFELGSDRDSVFVLFLSENIELHLSFDACIDFDLGWCFLSKESFE
jgi:hypothetical protein